MKKTFLIFDVESTDLFGTGFAVGAVVVNEKGEELDSFQLMSKESAAKANDWVKENVLPALSDMPTCKTDKELRDSFFGFYLKHKNTADIYSDVNFPVETNFLTAVAMDKPTERQFMMPYPLLDVANFIDVNINRIQECGISNLTAHNPLHDSRASAALLIQYFKIQKSRANETR